jgi:Mg/Co/Ni transporter MgtE
LDKLLKYEKVLTTQESATILEDMISKIITLMQENASGAYNIFNEGTISPSEIMDIFQHSHTKITKQELDELTKDKARRVSTILGTKRTTPMRSIRDRIVEIRNSWYINQK